MDMSMGSRFKRAWNTFFNRDPTHSYNDTGPGYFYRPDRTRFSRGNERSIVTLFNMFDWMKTSDIFQTFHPS